MRGNHSYLILGGRRILFAIFSFALYSSLSAQTAQEYYQWARDTMLYDISAFCALTDEAMDMFDISNTSIEKRRALAFKAFCYSYDDQFVNAKTLSDSILKCSPSDAISEIYAYGALGSSEQFQNRNEKAVENYLVALNLATTVDLAFEKGILSNAISQVFYDLEYFEKAVEYSLNTEKVGLQLHHRGLLAMSWQRLRSCYAGDEEKEHIQMAAYYKSKFDSLTNVLNDPSMKMYAAIDNGWMLKDDDQLDSAAYYYISGLAIARELKDTTGIALCLGNLGQIYILQRQKSKAKKVCEEIPNYLNADIGETSQLYLLRVLAEFGAFNQNFESAYNYLHEFVTRDEIYYDDLTRNELLDYEAKYEHLKQENEIAKQQLEIRHKANQRNLAYMGGGLVAALGLLAFGWLTGLNRNRSYEQNQMLLQTENELISSRMQMMRAQMNPHFLFNSLNSIKHFILQKDKDESAQYISDFSKLMRLNLQNSAEVLIPLEREVAFLKQYLLMEQMRFKDPFEVQWEIEELIDLKAYMFPPMLIQPYLENAIWHGLRYRKNVGPDNKSRIDVHISAINHDNLVCIIQDNGVGRVKSKEINASSLSLKRSMGTKITEDRIAMTNTLLKSDIRVHTEDLYHSDLRPAGTRVTIYIPYINEIKFI